MVKFSFRPPNADYLGFEATPEGILTTACKAETLGFDAVLVNDHIIVDSDSGRPVQEMTGFAAAVIPMLMLERFEVQFGWSRELIVLAGAAIYFGVRFGAAELPDCGGVLAAAAEPVPRPCLSRRRCSGGIA